MACSAIVPALLISFCAVTARSTDAASLSSRQTAGGVVPAGATVLYVIPDDYAEPLDGWSPRCSADHTFCAYHARRGPESFVVVNGKPGPVYEDVRSIVFSRSGQVAYEARRNGVWVVVTDGKEGPPFDRIEHLTFGGNVVAYVGERATRRRVVVGARMSEEDSAITGFTLSRDGTSYAYVVTREQTMVSLSGLFLNGKYFWEDNLISSVSFTNDGRLVFASRTGTAGKGRSKLMMGDEVLSEHSEILTAIAISSDGKQWAPVGCVGAAAQRRCVLTRDGATVREAAAIDLPTFAPDGSTLAYAARPVGGQWRVVVGDRTGPDVDAVLGPIVFSADSRRYAYPVRKGRSEAVVVDHVVGPSFEAVEDLVFSDDSNHFAYTATHSGEQRVVLDQFTGPAFRWVSEPGFDAGGKTLTFVAQEGRRFMRVMVPVGAGSAGVPRK